jgi:hypothetical protein
MDQAAMTTDNFRSRVDSRCELMLDVTCRTLEEDPDLKLCEGLRLIEATRRAVARIAPDAVEVFESEVLPRLRKILMERFGVSELPSGPVN